MLIKNCNCFVDHSTTSTPYIYIYIYYKPLFLKFENVVQKHGSNKMLRTLFLNIKYCIAGEEFVQPRWGITCRMFSAVILLLNLGEFLECRLIVFTTFASCSLLVLKWMYDSLTSAEGR